MEARDGTKRFDHVENFSNQAQGTCWVRTMLFKLINISKFMGRHRGGSI